MTKPPLTPPLPLRGEGKGEGISNLDHWNLFVIWPACAKSRPGGTKAGAWYLVLIPNMKQAKTKIKKS
jgi:hypothetical protein